MSEQLDTAAGPGPTPADPDAPAAFLELRDLSVHFPTDDGLVKSVDGLSFRLERGQTLGIVGESGSGKSVTSLAILGLHKRGNARINGQIWLDGRELVSASAESVRKLRGKKMAMIFQDPLSAMHPYYTVGAQIIEAYRIHNDVSRRAARTHAIDMLNRVGIPKPSTRVDDYPHQFSGGMRQRAMIAMALSCDPELLIADEPTTALDVTVQAQILDLLQDLQREYGSAIVMITHDLGVIAEIADDVLVMYGGRAVESGPTKSILTLPEMPYTWGLLSSVPDISGDTDVRLVPIPGTPPSMLTPPTGCSFHPRCPHVDKVAGDLCRTTLPELAEASQPGHLKRCHLVNPDEIYLKEVLPEAAPDLLDPETGAAIPELQEQIDEIQGENP